MGNKEISRINYHSKKEISFHLMKHQQVYYVATLAIFLLSMSSAFAIAPMVETGASPMNRMLAAKAAAPKKAAPKKVAKKAATKAPAKSKKTTPKKAGPHKKLTKKQIAKELKGLKEFLHKTAKVVKNAKKEVVKAKRVVKHKIRVPKKPKAHKKSLKHTLAHGGIAIKKGSRKANQYDYLMVYVTRRFSKKQLDQLSAHLKKKHGVKKAAAKKGAKKAKKAKKNPKKKAAAAKKTTKK